MIARIFVLVKGMYGPEKKTEQGAYHNLFQELLLGDAKSFKEFIRMDRLHFQFLVERLYPRLIKRDKVYHEKKYKTR